MKSNSSITSMKDFVFSWKSLPDKASMMNLNMHNLKYCESLIWNVAKKDLLGIKHGTTESFADAFKDQNI
ncbi:CLUMA_CG020410, isoform A [Clunio marinus]|uniref:CLUMA_CG020410, isoform A n=1 Tax=Clunio marinus TaxID=568069 RepID=A0A1J1J4X2_9DIPT|nr:CLUMA_CG020410, isoform A [Clunio marinus]